MLFWVKIFLNKVYSVKVTDVTNLLQCEDSISTSATESISITQENECNLTSLTSLTSLTYSIDDAFFCSYR